MVSTSTCPVSSMCIHGCFLLTAQGELELAARFPALPGAPFVTARDTSASAKMPLATPNFR